MLSSECSRPLRLSTSSGSCSSCGRSHCNYFGSPIWRDELILRGRDITAAIGGAVWIVGLWRYAKHAPAIKRSVVLAAIGFAAAIGYEQLVDDHLWVCEMIACAALIPALRATARAVAADPVPTTADVFA